MITLSKHQAYSIATDLNEDARNAGDDTRYTAKMMRGQWVVWCITSAHVVELGVNPQSPTT